jgi:hypothetical protein
MSFYLKKYHSAPVRFLQSFFVQTPATLWFRLLAPLALFWQKETFINNTSLTLIELMAIWSTAQQGLATQKIPTNTIGSGLVPPDPRALTVLPKNVTVNAVPDWDLTDLIKVDLAWAGHAVPTGTFTVGLDNETVSGITLPWTRPRVYGAASVLSTVLVWEFQNVILSQLGYDVSNR